VFEACRLGIGCDAKANLARNWCMRWSRHIVEETLGLAREVKLDFAAGFPGCPERRPVYTSTSAQVHVISGSHTGRIQSAQVPPKSDSCPLWENAGHQTAEPGDTWQHCADIGGPEK
jgi:hypothetical protein